MATGTQWYLDRIKAGLCACCREKANPGKTLCETHRLRSLKYGEDSRRALGQKARGPRIPLEERAGHKQRWQFARRDRLEKSGICIWCGRDEAAAGRNRCQGCIEKGRATQNRYLARKAGA